MIVQRSLSLEFLPFVQIKINQDHRFSRVQSNILYGLFFFGTTIIFCMDVGYQIARKNEFNNITLTFFGIFLLNIVLWITVNFELHQKIKTNEKKGNFEELMDASSDSLFCLVVAPLYWCSARIRLVLLQLVLL